MASIYRVMHYTSPNIRRQPLFKSGRRHLLLSLGLVFLFLVAVLLGSIHHHHDLQDHPNCAICAVAHHPGIETAAPSPSAVYPPELPALGSLLILVAVIARPNTILRSRAPPR
jgi:hypothetical protein